jgi:hypothetical protein
MTNPESRSVALDELAPSNGAGALDNDENQITEADIRELEAYGFDSDYKTLVGISPRSSAVDHFDSSDETLVGIGPVERAERASRARAADEAPDSVRMPQSEPPGPFVASDDDELPAALPMHKAGPWALVIPALLVAVAGVALVRGIVPHHTAASMPPAAIEARPATAGPSMNSEGLNPQLETTTALLSAAEAAIETSVAPTTELAASPLPPLAVSREKAPELVRPTATKRLSGRAATLGSLDINASPSSSVVLDGRPLGKAPRVVPIAPGLHTVVFIHPERGRMLLNINVTAGETTSASADF